MSSKFLDQNGLSYLWNEKIKKLFVDKYELAEVDNKVTALRSAVGSPLVAETVSEMTDVNKVYVYTGTESGYTSGNWYYYDDDEWVSGGVYNSVAISVDDTLTVEGGVADAKAVGNLFDTIVESQTDEPSDEWNRIWVEQSDDDIEIPEMKDLNELKSALWYDRDGEHTYLRAWVAYNVTSLSTFSIVTDMPSSSFVFSEASKFIDSLGSGFTWTLTSTTTYVIEKWRRGRDVGDFQYRIRSLGGLQEFVGYAPSSNPSNITWNNVSYGDLQDALEDAVEAVETMQAKVKACYHDGFRPGDFVLFTDIAAYPDGWWTTGGVHGSNTYTRTELLPCYPGEIYYITNLPNNTTAGAFFDINGDFVVRLLKSAVTSVSYQKANGYTQNTSNYLGDDSSDYSGIYRFTVPEDCYFVSFNINSTQLWHITMCSKPIFQINSFWENNRPLAEKVMDRDQNITDEEWAARVKGANIVIPQYDQAYQEYGQRKLCVIGPSTCMIDRRNPNKNGMTQYIAGWQEYMMPYYGDVVSYGYSGASWGDGYIYDSQYYSIHTMICGNSTLGITGVDLSGYDDFILMGSSNGIVETGAGDWDTSSPDTDTYLGALRATVEYIYAANDKARIWIFNVNRAGAASSKVETIEAVNDGIADMCQTLSLNPVNFATVGFSSWARTSATGGEQGWTYDGTHYNQTGSRMLGQYMRHLVLGR